MAPWIENIHHISACQKCGYWINPAAEGFTEGQAIRFINFMLVTEIFPRACHACLNLVQYKKDIVFFTESLGFAEIAFARNFNADFCLNRLDKESASLRRN